MSKLQAELEAAAGTELLEQADELYALYSTYYNTVLQGESSLSSCVHQLCSSLMLFSVLCIYLSLTHDLSISFNSYGRARNSC